MSDISLAGKITPEEPRVPDPQQATQGLVPVTGSEQEKEVLGMRYLN